VQNFRYYVPTEIYFGRGQICHLTDAIRRFGSRVLLVYGGGSIRKTGLYDVVLSQLRAGGVTVTELPGVDPNPRIETVRQGAALCRRHDIQVVLAVGGGSVIDCSKAVAAGARYDGDPWDLVLDHAKVRDALPVVSVLTIAATGSEMNGFAVISNLAVYAKQSIFSPLLVPKVSILDPEYTFTVPAYHTAAGTADIMSHLFELYFKKVEGAYLQPRLIEGLLKTCVHCGAKAVQTPDDYGARANLMWASTWAINGFLAAGFAGTWSCHAMEHPLSAYYDVAHGAGLAVITPVWMRHILGEKTVDLFAAYGRAVWDLPPEADPYDTARRAIDKTAAYFAQLGLPGTLRALGISEKDKFEEMAVKAVGRGLGTCYVPLHVRDVVDIHEAAY
jgi:alcohol dehydrogenase YqhD (iron-dependent ADH family)